MQAPRPGGAAARRVSSRTWRTFTTPGLRRRALPRVPARAARPAEGADFWTWRDAMLELAGDVARVADATPTSIAELRDAGYTAVGEFHYLGLEEARAAAEAAATRASSSSCSTSRMRAAASSASGRRRSPTTCASSRSCARRASASASPPTPSAPARATGSSSSALCARARPAAARPRGRAAARDRGVPGRARRAADRAARRSRLPGPRTTVVHATHADGRELDLLAEAGARICACPTTEANLGDGFLPVARVLHRGIGLCIGSDSNVRIDPLEELRELDGIARRQTGRRDIFTVDALLSIGADEGAASLGLEAWPTIEIDLGAPAAARRRRSAVRARARLLGRRRRPASRAARARVDVAPRRTGALVR